LEDAPLAGDAIALGFANGALGQVVKPDGVPSVAETRMPGAQGGEEKFLREGAKLVWPYCEQGVSYLP